MSQESKEMDQMEMVMIKHEVIPLHTISTSITLNSQYAMYSITLVCIPFYVRLQELWSH